MASVCSRQMLFVMDEMKTAHRLFFTTCCGCSVSFWKEMGEASKFKASSKAGFD